MVRAVLPLFIFIPLRLAFPSKAKANFDVDCILTLFHLWKRLGELSEKRNADDNIPRDLA